MHQFLALFSLWTMFYMNIAGFGVYLAYLSIPFLITKAKLKYPSYIKIIFALIIFVYFFPVLIKFYLLKDILKILIMVLYFFTLKTFVNKKKIYDVIDISVVILVLYGLFQYIAFNTGNDGYALWLHQRIIPFHGGLSAGTAQWDYSRAGVGIRVSSLTQEPSYFAFTVGVYFFITKRVFVKAFCLLGFTLSLSFISMYSFMAIVGFWLAKKIFKVNLLIYMLIVFLIHVIFVQTVYNLIPEAVLPTFSARYGGLSEWSHSTFIEIITGVYDSGYPDGDKHIWFPYSNLSSLAVNFGIIGIFIYSYLLSRLGRKNDMAALALYLYGFNFYYLTGWPPYVVFVYMIYLERDHRKHKFFFKPIKNKYFIKTPLGSQNSQNYSDI